MNQTITITDDSGVVHILGLEKILLATHDGDKFNYYCDLNSGKKGRKSVTKIVDTEASPALEDERNFITVTGKGDFAGLAVYINLANYTKVITDGDSGSYCYIETIGTLPNKIQNTTSHTGLATAIDNAVTAAYEEQAV